MKYSKELTDKIVKDYQAGIMVGEIAQSLQVPMRSVIAKLSSMGIYQKRQYLNKRGEVPVKKFEMIENLAELPGVPSDQLESLEKVNKSVLILLQKRLCDPKLG